MYQEIIDPPDDEWTESTDTLDWLDDLYEEKGSIEDALFDYECKVYNELERRYA